MPGQRRPASRDARSPARPCAHRPRSALTASFPILTPPPPPPRPATGAHDRVRPGLVGAPRPGAARTNPLKMHELELMPLLLQSAARVWRPDTSAVAAGCLRMPPRLRLRRLGVNPARHRRLTGHGGRGPRPPRAAQRSSHLLGPLPSAARARPQRSPPRPAEAHMSRDQPKAHGLVCHSLQPSPSPGEVSAYPPG